MRLRTYCAAAAALGALALTSEAFASYPAGVWVKVEQVVLEPASGPATKIQIHGAVMLYDGSTSGPYSGYTAPALGYLYYSCPAGSEATCASEWADIQKNANEPLDVCVGLGDQKVATGSLRAPGSPVENPDAYPIAMGVLPGFSPCAILESFLLAADGGAGAGGAAGASGSGGDAGSAGATSSGGTGGGTGGSTSTGGSSGSGGSSAGTGGSSTGSGGSSSGSGGSAGASGGGDSGDDGGCTISSGRASSTLGWMGLVGLAMLGARRLRRRET